MTIGGAVFLSFSLSAPGSSAYGSGSSTASTSFFPSGDQAKSSTPPFVSVIFSASPPRRFQTQSWSFSRESVRDERNARLLPSGEKRGWVCVSSPNVMGKDSKPFQFASQRFTTLLSLARSNVLTV